MTPRKIGIKIEIAINNSLTNLVIKEDLLDIRQRFDVFFGNRIGPGWTAKTYHFTFNQFLQAMTDSSRASFTVKLFDIFSSWEIVPRGATTKDYWNHREWVSLKKIWTQDLISISLFCIHLTIISSLLLLFQGIISTEPVVCLFVCLFVLVCFVCFVLFCFVLFCFVLFVCHWSTKNQRSNHFHLKSELNAWKFSRKVREVSQAWIIVSSTSILDFLPAFDLWFFIFIFIFFFFWFFLQHFAGGKCGRRKWHLPGRIAKILHYFRYNEATNAIFQQWNRKIKMNNK